MQKKYIMILTSLSLKENLNVTFIKYFNCTEALTFINVQKNKYFQNVRLLLLVPHCGWIESK